MFTLHHKVVTKQRAIMKKSIFQDGQKKVKSKMFKRKSNQKWSNESQIKVKSKMVNNSANTKKVNKYLSSQIIELKV
jgi:hypothetical protein